MQATTNKQKTTHFLVFSVHVNIPSKLLRQLLMKTVPIESWFLLGFLAAGFIKDNTPWVSSVKDEATNKSVIAYEAAQGKC